MSSAAVEPIGAVALGDLPNRHAAVGIEVGIVRDLAAVEDSGIRLRNLV